MEDKELFARILGLHPPWFIKQVVVNDPEQRIDIYLDHEPGFRFAARSVAIFM